MKYIRTNDGRIVKHPHPNAQVFTFRYEILKTTDTIEELCDRFVYDEDIYFSEIVNGCLETYDYEGNEVKITKEMIKKGIYGAIWTDKGLIYVAKMNDKGELELL